MQAKWQMLPGRAYYIAIIIRKKCGRELDRLAFDKIGGQESNHDRPQLS